jgi:hypothetical protein
MGWWVQGRGITLEGFRGKGSGHWGRIYIVKVNIHRFMGLGKEGGHVPRGGVGEQVREKEEMSPEVAPSGSKVVAVCPPVGFNFS